MDMHTKFNKMSLGLATLCLMASLAVPALADNATGTSTASTEGKSACMQAATAKKNVALKAAHDTYTAAVQNATGKDRKAIMKKARQDKMKAQATALKQFKSDAKACRQSSTTTPPPPASH